MNECILLFTIILTERHLCLRQDGSGRGSGIGQWDSAIVHAPVPGAAIGRRRVRRRGAVGGRARPGAGGRAAVVGQGREQGVLSEAFVLELQLEVLADFLRESLVLLLQFPLQLRLELDHKHQQGINTCTALWLSAKLNLLASTARFSSGEASRHKCQVLQNFSDHFWFLCDIKCNRAVLDESVRVFLLTTGSSSSMCCSTSRCLSISFSCLLVWASSSWGKRSKKTFNLIQGIKNTCEIRSKGVEDFRRKQAVKRRREKKVTCERSEADDTLEVLVKQVIVEELEVERRYSPRGLRRQSLECVSCWSHSAPCREREREMKRTREERSVNQNNKSSNKHVRLQTAGLHFSLVFVAALGFADAVLSLPVQDLLELLLLPANTNTNQHYIRDSSHGCDF